MPKVTTTLFDEINFFPYQPKNPMVETLQWNTSVAVSSDGTEDRQSNRDDPQQSFALSVPLGNSDRREAMNSLYGALREDWYLPLWGESQEIGTVLSGQTTIDCNTIPYNFNLDSVEATDGIRNVTVDYNRTIGSAEGIISSEATYVYTFSGSTLYKLNASDFSTADSTTISRTIECIDTNGTVVAVLRSSVVYILLCSDLSLVDTFYVGTSGNSGISIQDSRFFVSDQLNRQILVRNLATGASITTINHDGTNTGLNIHTDDDYLYLTQFNDDNVKIYNVDSYAFIQNLSVTGPLFCSSDASSVYFLYDGTIELATSVIDYSRDFSQSSTFTLPVSVRSIDFENSYTGSSATVLYEFNGIEPITEAGLAVLKSGSDWQILEYTEVDTDNITVLSVEDMTDAYLMPVKKGIFTGNPIEKSNGFESTVEIKFLVDDDLDFNESTPPQYDGDDVRYDIVPYAKTRLPRTLQKNRMLTDYNLGPIAHSTLWENTKISFPYKTILDGPSEVYDFRDFLYRCAGKFRQFWAPSHIDDVRIISVDGVGNDLLVESDSIIDYVQERDHIVIVDLDGNHYPRQITTFTQTSETQVTLRIDSAISLQPDEISSISWLGLHRLNSDKITLKWIGNGVVNVNCGLTELSP